LSFISLRKVLPAALACAAPASMRSCSLKPQFEVGREACRSRWRRRDPALRREALIAIADCAHALGAAVMGFASSGLPGPKGNLESFAWLRKPGEPGRWRTSSRGQGDRAVSVVPEPAPTSVRAQRC